MEIKRDMRDAAQAGGAMREEGPRYAIYFVPAPDSALYRFGSSILGYDCYTGETVPHPDELAHDAASWRRFIAEPRRYGFHATLKAPFHLSAACTEPELINALQNIAAEGHVIPTITPVIQVFSGFAAVMARTPETALDELAAHCTRAFDVFRAPMSSNERARRIATGLNPAQIENLDRWGYPYLFAQFRFHMTLTGRIDLNLREPTVASLRRSFERRCGYRTVPIDRLALLKQEAPQAAFRVLTHAQLPAAHYAPGTRPAGHDREQQIRGAASAPLPKFVIHCGAL